MAIIHDTARAAKRLFSVIIMAGGCFAQSGNAAVLVDMRVTDTGLVDIARHAAIRLHNMPAPPVTAGWTTNDRALCLTNNQAFVSLHAPEFDAWTNVTAFTMEVWSRPSRVAGSYQILHKLVNWSSSGYGSGACSIGFNDGVPYAGVYVVPETGSANAVPVFVKAAGGRIATDEWIHLAGVFNGQRMALYVNGVETAAQAAPKGRLMPSTADAGLLIAHACSPGANTSFDGLVGRVRVRDDAGQEPELDAAMRTILAEQAERRARDAPAPDRIVFRGESCRVGYRPGSDDTTLIQAAQPQAVIIAPADPVWREYGERLAAALAQCTGIAIPVLTDSDAIIGHCRGLKPEFQARPAILLGNINNNEAIVPLYARYLSFADGEYPGPGGFAIRTIRNPYGTLANTIVLEASDEEGLAAATEAFLASNRLRLAPGSAECGFLMDIQPALDAAKSEAIASTSRELRLILKSQSPDAAGQIEEWLAGMGYLITGDAVFADALRAWARNAARPDAPLLGAADYSLEKWAHAYRIASNNQLLDADTVRRLDIHAIQSLYGMRDAYWLALDSRPGNRHQMAGTSAYLLFIMDLFNQHTANGSTTDPLIQEFLSNYYRLTADHFRYLAANTYSGEDDSNEMESNMTSLFQSAFVLGDMTGFESGLAREGAAKMLATVDNWGYGIGAGTYEDAYPEGAAKTPYANGTPLLYATFYYRDPVLKWRMQNQAGLDAYGSWFGRFPFKLHAYATGATLPPVAPSDAMKVLRVEPRPLNTRGYKESAGFPESRLYDKAVIRTGPAPEDAYLCFQGVPGELAEDFMALLRYTEKSVLWVAANCQLTERHWRSGFEVSEGFGLSAGDPFPRLDALGSAAGCQFFSATARNARGGEWNRWAVYREGFGLTLVDCFTAGRAGEYAVCQTIKTPIPVDTLSEPWTACQSGYRMSFCPADNVTRSADRGVPEMDAQPFWYVRHHRQAALRAGESIAVAAYLPIRPIEDSRPVVIREISPQVFLVACGDNMALVGRGPYQSETFRTDAALWRVEATQAWVAGQGGGAADTNANGVVDVAWTGGTFAPLIEKHLAERPPAAARPSNENSPTNGIVSAERVTLEGGRIPEPIRGYSIIAPASAHMHKVNDNVVARWDTGATLEGPVVVDFHQPVTLRRIEMTPPCPTNPVLQLWGSIINPAAEEFAIPIESIRMEEDWRELYKMSGMCLRWSQVSCQPARLRYLRLSQTPAHLAELAFFSDRSVAADIRRLKVADVDGDGHEDVCVETRNRTISMLSADGRALFTLRLPCDIIDFLVSDLDGDRKPETVVACFDDRLYCFDHAGQPKLEPVKLFQHPYTLQSVTSVGGKRRVALTYYYHGQFLDETLTPVAPPEMIGGMWLNSAGHADVDGDGAEDILTHDIFGHSFGLNGKTLKPFHAGGLSGISSLIRALEPAETSGPVVLYGGMSQAALYRYARGTAAAERLWVAGDDSVFAKVCAADLDGDGREEIMAAKALGQIVVWSQDGKLQRIARVDGILNDLDVVRTKGGIFILAAASNGLRVYDTAWKEVARFPGPVTCVAATGDTLWATREGDLWRLQLAP